MTTQQWQLVKELFEAALERSGEDQAAFLAEACPEDSEVRAEVESLLAAHARDSDFMTQPAGSLLGDGPPILLTGQHLGNYEVLSTLGKGGMGQVYLALDTRLGRKVALKLLPFSKTRDPNHVKQLEQEARTASALNHPNIVTIHEIGEADSIHFMATEYVDGETLRQRMLDTQLPVREIVVIAVQIASALRAAHKAGIVHRDIKPENIMLRSDGVVKVLDFGLAKLTGGGDSETESGLIMGTTPYMSPEQARGETVDARTDVWSHAVVIYEMIAGHVPFTGETHREVVTSILKDEPPTLDNDSTLPDELKQIVARALSKDRTKRYDNASTIESELKSLQGELEVRARLELANVSQDDGVTGRIGLATLPHLRTNTAGHTRRNIKDFVQRHKVLTGIAVVVLTGAVSWAYLTGNRAKTTSSSITKRSIAVLPLKPINSATRDAVYETGIAESLIQKLGEMDGVVVRQLSATRHYTELGQDPMSAGKEQQVDYVVASTYYVEGSKIHITAELFNIRTAGVEEKFEVEAQTTDAFAMQDAVATDLGNKLLRQFATTAIRQTAKRGTTNREAYRLYLHGMYLANNRNLADSQKAIQALQQAVELDPNYAQAWAGLGYAHRTVSIYSPSSSSTHETYQKSIAAINKALAIDEGLSEAHSALCENKYLYEWDFAGAERECKRAIELDPNSAQAHEIFSRYLMGRGRLDEAITEIETAIDLEPASRFNNRNYGRALFYARRYREAEEQFKRVLAMDATFVSTYSWLTSTLALQGKEAEAYDWFKKLLAYRKADKETVEVFEKAFQSSGWRGIWREWLKRFDTVGGGSFDPALYNSQLGNKDQAFKSLEDLYRQRAIWLTYLRVEPRLDPLRDDPRFQDLLRRVEGK